MCVDDFLAKESYCLGRILTCDHNEVCRVKVYAYSVACSSNEAVQGGGCFGTGFYSKGDTLGFCLVSALGEGG